MALFPQHGSPGPAPAGHRGQVAVVHVLPVRQFLQGEAVPPGRRPKLALGLAFGLSLLRRPGLFLRSQYGLASSCSSNRVALPVMVSALWLLVVAVTSLPPKHRKRGCPQ